MSLMLSSIVDSDGKFMLASCPIYSENPICVNSCALFEPIVEKVLNHNLINYEKGRCSLGSGRSQVLRALEPEQEAAYRKARGWD